MNFQVGDIVRVIADRDYSVTTIGSVGTINRISSEGAEIEFSEIASEYQAYIGDTFTISLDHIEPLIKLPLEAQILNKVNQIYARQLKRGIL